MDTDFHHFISDDGAVSKMEKPILIGKNVWIGARAMVLKGSSIANGCIIAANSHVVRTFENERCIIGGNPCAVIKQGCQLLVNE